MKIIVGPDGKKRQLTDEQYKEYRQIKSDYDFWDRKQAVRKVMLNSCYGALLNRFFRFSDQRMGQSVTLSGRVVMKHMARSTNKEIMGKYEFGEAIIYGDTDSVFFTLQKEFSSNASIDDVVKRADDICKKINDGMADAMSKSFFISKERNTISIGREIVGSRAMFKAGKKRYAIAIVDKEGSREKSMKIMGMDTKRTEIPENVRKFLKECIEAIVRDRKEEKDLKSMTKTFVDSFLSLPPWEMGRLCKVSNLTAGAVKRKKFDAGEIPNPRLHFSIIACDNTNQYIKFFNETDMELIRDGDRVAIFDLKNSSSRNPLDFDSIALPLGTRVVPDWFKNLSFNVDSMLEKLVYRKLEVTFDVLKWNLKPSQTFSDDVFS